MTTKQQLITTGDSSYIQNAWANRQKKINRTRIALPDLTAVIAPSHDLSPHIIKRMQRFDMNRGGFAANTVKGMCSALRKWRDYCVSHRIYAFPLSDDAHFELFLQALVLSHYSVATVQQCRSLISSFYDYLGIPNPASTRDIRAFMKSLKEDYIDLTGNAYTQKQASPLRRHHIEALYQLNDTQPIDRHYFYHIRDIAFIALAYSTCLRMSEIRHVKKRHVEIDSSGTKIRLHRTRSKTSTSVKAKIIEGVAATRFIAYFNRVKDRLEDDHYIFSHITPSYRVITPHIPLTNSVTINIFKRQCLRLQRASLLSNDTQSWSAHSARVGRVQDGREIDNLTDLELQRLGEWTTMRMVSLYLRGLIDGE